MGAAFSLFDWVTKQATATESPSSAPANKVHLQMSTEQRFTASVRGMLHWCRLNERLVAQHHANEARVYAGFERFSRVARSIRRYRDIGRVVQKLTVFGCPDVPLPLGAEKIAVSEDHPLAREWFLIINAPEYKALIAARDLDGFGPTGPLANRRFSGIALHHERLVQNACEHLDSEASQLANGRTVSQHL